MFHILSGMAVCLAQDVIDNAFVDLNAIDNENGGASSRMNSKTSIEALPQAGNRKRKHGTTTGSLEWRDRSSIEMGAPKNNPTILISLRIAALEAIEALLTVVCVLEHLFLTNVGKICLPVH